MRIPLRKISGLYLCAHGCQGPNRWTCELLTALRVAEKYLRSYLAAVLWITDPTDIVQLSNVISCSIDGIKATYHCVGSVILMTQSDFLSHEAQTFKKQRSGKKKHGKYGHRKQLRFHTVWPAGTVAVSVWKWMAVAEMHQTTWLLRLKFGHDGPGGQDIAKSDEFLANDGNNIIKFTKLLMHVDAFNKHSSYCDFELPQLSVKCQERKERSLSVAGHSSHVGFAKQKYPL